MRRTLTPSSHGRDAVRLEEPVVRHAGNANPRRVRRIRHVLSTAGQLPVDRHSEPVSGVAGAPLAIAASQAAQGNRVEVFGWRPGRATRSRMGALTVVTHPGWGALRFWRWDLRWLAPMAVIQLKAGIMAGPVDVLHVHLDPNLLLLPRARKRVLHLHSQLAAPLPSAYQRLLARADAVICCSNFLRRRFLLLADYPPERVFAVHNGADVRSYDQSDGRTLRARWGFDEDDIIVFCAGAIVPAKGILYAIRAVRQIASDAPNVHLVIVGARSLWLDMTASEVGWTARAYEAEVQRCSGRQVHWMGMLPQGDMPLAFQAADIVVTPSVCDEALGMVICEAMAAGRPVIASNIGGIPELVVHEETGLLVPPGDPDALAAALLRLVRNEPLRRAMGERAHGLAATRLTWSRAATELESVYATILGAD